MTAKKAVSKKVKSGFVKKHVLAIGAGVAALGAATYYFFGPKGKKHQKDFKDWMIHMEKDVMVKFKRTEKLTKTAYNKVVDEVAKAYAKNGKPEVARFAKKLKSQWKHVEKSVKQTTKHIAKKVAKKTSKKK